MANGREAERRQRRLGEAITCGVTPTSSNANSMSLSKFVVTMILMNPCSTSFAIAGEPQWRSSSLLPFLRCRLKIRAKKLASFGWRLGEFVQQIAVVWICVRISF